MVSRRKFLGISLAAASSMLLRNVHAESDPDSQAGADVRGSVAVNQPASVAAAELVAAPEAALYEAPVLELGRVAGPDLPVYAEPHRDAEVLRTVRFDDVLPVRKKLAGDALRPHNDQWFQIDEGYVYSSLVQPVRDVKNDARPEEAQAGFWGEVTVPFVDSRFAASLEADRSRRLYYGSVYRVIAAAQDAESEWWYRLQYGVSRSPGPWAPAAAIRRFDPVDDLAPLSPEVTDKRIEIRLAEQSMTAYEGGRAVMKVRVSTGAGSMFTPVGRYRVFRKAPGQWLVGGRGADRFDLPGVPFVTYFTYSGIAIHGAYWHNDYGVKRSHGCINVLPEVARWFWRWTTPVAPVNAPDIWFRPTQGTLVEVV
jgi:hypothetical protein